MVSNDMKINSKIEIVDEQEVYKSIVQDVRNEFIAIGVPVSNGVYLPLRVGQEIEINYLIEGANYYKCNSKVLRRYKDNNIPMYMITKPYNIVKIQRRNHVRVPVTEYSFYRSIIEDGKKGEWKKGLILDLSGGGARVKFDDKLNLDDKVEINIILGEDKMPVSGKVVRIEFNEHKETIYGIRFEELDELNRDKIIKKVFSLMIKQRKLE